MSADARAGRPLRGSAPSVARAIKNSETFQNLVCRETPPIPGPPLKWYNSVFSDLMLVRLRIEDTPQKPTSRGISRFTCSQARDLVRKSTDTRRLLI
ncbi:hypothetical protein EVAR_95926_1 [Eumeta japonica]|uniref:Uncharacterized protein n=1 Tax=Eumeta variegata TaxID=151549 RepID=A0A4C1V8X6_EUMVA|nr:hypothetical protein EVAR_95926_1 [Eumeta japonica]